MLPHILILMITATVHLKTIKNNIKRLRHHLMPGVKICAVVKANAYSLGDVRISQFLQPLVFCFGVSNIAEAVRLRENAVTKPILLFGVCEDFKTAVRHKLTVSVNHPRELKELTKTLAAMPEENINVHIKINTGMNRYGLNSIWQLRNILAEIETNPQIKVEGLYTHFAFETNNTAMIDAQLKRFAPFLSVFSRKFPKAIIHAACSGSAHYLPAQFDMVRIGKTLYGGFDGYETAIEITSKIAAVQKVAPRQYIGYGGAAFTRRTMSVGVVPCGYADCAHIHISSNSAFTPHIVYVDNIPCPVLGRVCMDCLMIDVSAVQNPIGKTAVIISQRKGQSIMEIAHNTNSIACNILTSLNFQRSLVKY